jgi:RIO-like serine/threonine protein kinase
MSRPMSEDMHALKLLEYLDRRVSAVVGDNAERIAQALGMSVAEFEQARESLCTRGLVRREAMAEGIYALRITDAGIAAAEEHKHGAERLQRRPWWRFW